MTLACPHCKCKLHVPKGRTEGYCPQCNAHLLVKSNPPKGGKGVETVEEKYEKFHGVPVQKWRVVKVPKLPETAFVIGRLKSITYWPHDKSKRGETLWEHEFGDYGPLRPKGKHLPLLAVSADGKQLLIIRDKSKFYFDEEAGIVG